MKNNRPFVSQTRHVRRLWAGALVALLCASTTAPSLAADAKPPSPDASCIASAQNRSTPPRDGGDYVLENLPGSGLVPFGTTDAQPFRIRATCSDGTVGETPLAFPAFGQSLVLPGAIVWGQNTPVPTRLRFDLPSYVIGSGNPSIAGQVTARYADCSEKSVTARTAGTGYRSSGHAGFSGAAARVLTRAFPPRVNVLDAMAEEAAHSRLLGGIHFRHDNEDGLVLGRKVADKVLAAPVW